jgi:hypothetical protein
MARVHAPISLRRALPALNVASATLGSMRTRTLIATGAWLLGAAAATAGSLLVVSELGEGIAAAPGQQQSAAPVLNQAQASQVLPSSSSRSRSQGETSRTGTTGGTGGTGGTSGTRGTGGTSTTSGTVLTSSGGTVVARCATAGALLLSWSPQQGFQAGSVVRGPAATARVVFTATASTVTMAVSCSSGMPSAATTVTNAEVEDNGGGEGGGGGNSGPGGGGGGGGGGDG